MRPRIHCIVSVISSLMEGCMVLMKGRRVLGWRGGWVLHHNVASQHGAWLSKGGFTRHEPNHETRHRPSSVSGTMADLRHRFLAPRRIRDTSTCVSSAPMKGTPRAFSGWRRCRYAIRQPRRGKRPRPRHRQIPGSLRKIFILVLPRPGACHGVRPACPASVCCVHGPRLR